MRKITLMIVVSLMSFFAQAQLAVEHFDDPWVSPGGTYPAAPPNWTVLNQFGPNFTWVQTTPGDPQQPPFGGDGHSAFLTKENVAPGQPIPTDWLVTKAFNVPANAQLTFQSRLTIGQNQGSIFKIYIHAYDSTVTNANVQATDFTNDPASLLYTFNEIELNGAAQVNWVEKVLTIPASWEGQNVRIALVMEGDDHERWFIDDLKVTSQCVAPTNGTLTARTINSGTFTWDSPVGVTKWEIEVVPANSAPTGSGEVYQGTLPYTKAGLAECTPYKFYVRSLCDDGGTSQQWLGPVFFQTSCLGETCESPKIIDPANPTDSNNTNNFADVYEGSPGTSCNGVGNYLAGNDVVYSFTPTTTGNYNVKLSDTGGPAGMFIYSACSNIGVSCLNGATATNTAPADIASFPMTAGTPYYIVISTNGTPQTTPYTISIQQIFCPQPTAGTAGNITNTSAALSWTAGTPGANSWQLVVQNAGGGLPSSTATPTNVTTNTNYGVSATTGTNGQAFGPAGSYEFYVRENCGNGNYSIWAGPFLFNTTQEASSLNYFENFDGASSGFTLANGTEPNKWVIGTGTSNSPTKSLYITNDNGVTNSYSNGSASVVHAFKAIQMPATVDQLSLSFDWRCFGENGWDFVRVWVVPDTYVPTPGVKITEDDGLQVGGDFNIGNAWQTANNIITAPAAWDGAVVKLVFEWTNDTSAGSNPPGAIDNIALKIVTCPQPSDLVIDDLNVTQADISWTAPSVVPTQYDIYASQSMTPPGDATQPTQNVPGTQTTATITPLITAATYFVWVRSHCSDTDKSFWTGPISFNTPQIPATMPYAENFDAGAHNFTLSNGTAPNKWVVGTSTSSSPTQSLYVSNDGTSYGYDSFNYTVVHAYRDIQLPANIPSGEILLNFDWKSVGVQWGSDLMKVYIAPVTFSPTVGTEISEGGDIVRTGPDYYNNDEWKTANNVISVPAAWNGTVRRVIFEWKNSWGGGNLPAAVDNVGLSVITCPAPSDLVLDALTIDTATIAWTAPASAPASYDYYYSTDATPPVATTQPSGNTTDTDTTLNNLAVSTYYYAWVRSNCDANGNSFWIGPLKFVTPQTPATMPYAENFDGAAPGYSLSASQESDNEWVVGTATSNSPTESLYVTNDGGTSNNYGSSNNGLSVVHAYRDIQLPANIASGQVLLNFDWKSVGVEWGSDVMRVYVTPVTFGPTEDEEISAGGDNIKVGDDYYDNSNWKTANNVVDIPASWNGNIVRVIFEWKSTWNNGVAAAVDNVGFSVITCPAPSDVTLTSIDGVSATISWTAPANGAPASYDYYLTTSPVPPVAGTVPTGENITSTTTTISGLPANTNYYIWVRSDCGSADGNSFWVGGINFNTPQIPATLPYAENFDGADPNYTFISLDQPNKWAVGTATFSTPAKSMYVTNDDGVTNNFTNNEESIIHAYRDIVIPAGTTDLDFTFDWKSVGEEWGGDYLTVWMVPLNYLPVSGTEITDSDGLQITAQDLYNNNIWKNESLVVPISSAQAGTTQRFVFQWVNNSYGGSTPAAVDNVEAKVLTCPKPSDQGVSNVGMTTATFDWTENGSANAWEVYVVEAGQPLPTTGTVGVQAGTNPFPYTGELESGTNYEYYVRSVCGTDDKSRWAGPFAFHTNICEVADQCPVDFILTDSGTSSWDMGWGSNTMTVTQNGIVIGTLGPQIQDTSGPVTVTLQMCKGLPYEVFWNPSFDSPDQVGLEIKNYLGQTIFQRVAGSVSAEQNTTIFTGLPYCSEITCPQPTNLQSGSVVNAPGTTQLTWTPGDTETKWEVIVQAEGGEFPSSTSVITATVTGDPMHIVENIAPSVPFEFYVRAICSDTDQSFWSGPLKFSVFTPPACADVTVVDDELVVIPPDTNYSICAGEELCVDFSATYYAAAAETTSYEVSSIDFIPPFPTLGGTSMPVGVDDIWGPRIVLPFEFCFMGDVYNAAQVGANGLVSFNADQPSGGGSGYYFDTQIPDANFPQRNAIYGVYQDTNPSIMNSFAHPNINYQVLGNYPCRALVVSFNELAQFQDPDCSQNPTIGAQSYQIVMYEITNIIEVYVKRRVPCTTWIQGAGLIGVQNADGTVAFTPPGRNTGPWTALEEAWRFTPNGNSTATFEWLRDGVVFSNDINAEVCASTSGTSMITARASYNLCNGDVIVRESNFSITVEAELPAVDVADVTKCANTGDDVTIELGDQVQQSPDYTYTYYATQADAEAAQNAIPATFVTDVTATVWVRAAKNGTTCFVTKSFVITVINAPTLTPIDNVTACGSYVLPALTGANANAGYYTGPGGTGDPRSAGETIVASQTIYVYSEASAVEGCSGEVSFTVTINEQPDLADIADVNACNSYELPALTGANANAQYYAAAGGTGTAMPAGTVISTVGATTIYVYQQTGTAPDTCTDEVSFTVNISVTPEADAPADVTVCETYKLPALTNGRYFTGQNGTGQELFADSDIETSQDIYVYAVSATNPDCFKQNVFHVEITPTPEFTFMDNCENNVYYLEAIAANGTFDIDRATYAWTGPDGFTSTERKMVPPVKGEYTVTVTTEAGCVNTETFEVLSTACLIPRGISPNGDKMNDEFDLTALDVRKLEIFNRYGQEVYSKSNYTKEWVGLDKHGNELPTGTYFYMIERANGESITGWVYINRQE